MGRKEIRRITRGSRHHGAYINVPEFRPHTNRIVISRIVDNDIDADRLEISLSGFGKQGLLLTARISEPANTQRLAVFISNAVAV